MQLHHELQEYNCRDTGVFFPKSPPTIIISNKAMDHNCRDDEVLLSPLFNLKFVPRFLFVFFYSSIKKPIVRWHLYSIPLPCVLVSLPYMYNVWPTSPPDDSVAVSILGFLRTLCIQRFSRLCNVEHVPAFEAPTRLLNTDTLDDSIPTAGAVKTMSRAKRQTGTEALTWNKRKASAAQGCKDLGGWRLPALSSSRLRLSVFTVGTSANRARCSHCQPFTTVWCKQPAPRHRLPMQKLKPGSPICIRAFSSAQ